MSKITNCWKEILSIVLVCLLTISVLNFVAPTKLYRDIWAYAFVYDSNIVLEKGSLDILSNLKDPFLSGTFGKTINAIQNFPGVILLLAIFSSITNIATTKFLLFFPIGQILYIVSAYLIGKIFFKDKFNTFLLVLYSSIGFFGPQSLRIDYSIIESSFLVLVFSSILWSIKKYIVEKKLRYLLLILLMVLANRVFYASTTMYLALFLLGYSSIFFIVYFMPKRLLGNRDFRPFLILGISSFLLSFLSVYSLGGFNVLQSLFQKYFPISSLMNSSISNILLTYLLVFIPILVIIAIFRNDNLFRNITGIFYKLFNVLFGSSTRTYFSIGIAIIFAGYFFFHKISYLVMGNLISRIPSLSFILPTFAYLIFIAQKWTLNTKNDERLMDGKENNDFFFVLAMSSFFVLLPTSLFLPFLITKAFEFLQIIFIVGLLLEMGRNTYLRHNRRFFLVFLFILMVLNNFTYAASVSAQYNLWDEKTFEGVYLSNKIIPEDSILVSDLKIAGGFLVADHKNVVIPFSVNATRSDALRNNTFYTWNSSDSLRHIYKMNVSYMVITKDMRELGVYLPSYLYPPISKDFVETIDSSDDVDKIFDNNGLFVFKLF